MEFDAIKTTLAFLVVIAAGTGGLLFAPIGMTTGTIVMMVLPSMIVFGLIVLALGVKHGEYRATR